MFSAARTWIHEKGAARPFQTPKELSKPKNASRFAKRIFGASPIYGFAEGVRLSLDVVSYNKSTSQYSIFSPADK